MIKTYYKYTTELYNQNTKNQLKKYLELDYIYILHNHIHMYIITHKNTGTQVGLKYGSGQTKKQVQASTCPFTGQHAQE